jgi:hypothetical protein
MHSQNQETIAEEESEMRNPMVTFINLEETANQQIIKQTKQRIKKISEKISSLHNGRQIVKDVLHNSYWKYKV